MKYSLIPLSILFIATWFIPSCSFNKGNQSELQQNALTAAMIEEDQLADNQLTEHQSIENQPLPAACPAQSDKIDPHAYLDVWQRIKHQLSFQVPNNQRIEAQKRWYLRHPDYIKRVSLRAAPYLFHIVEKLEENNLPLDLALLPIVESAFDPFAYSHGRASGMWQFIPSTGKRFGLEQNWWYDGRRDIYASTDAAIKLLSYLHDRFDGNWMHALAAYNSGEGNVSRAIKRNKKKNKPTDFWALKLPRETQAYVPKLLALADIIAQIQPNDENWLPIANLPYFDRVDTESQLDLTLAASMAEISMEELYILNPSFNQWATAPTGPHYIMLPIKQIEIFKQNLQQVPKGERIAFQQYKIKPGDSLIKIAKKFSTSVALLKANNRIHKNTIRAGNHLLIPVASESRDKYFKSNEQRLLTQQNRQREGQKIEVIVASGDSFWDLSRKYQVNIRSLAKWNNMAPTDTLKVGQKLVIWSKNTNANSLTTGPKNKTRKIYYKARSGDSLAKIANKFKVSLNDVKRWNRKIGSKKYLQPGDSLKLYVDITEQY